MTDEYIKDWQEIIIYAIANPDTKRDYSWVGYVYFHPPLGCFMYDDAPIPHWVIYPLIHSDILIHAGKIKHQGEFYEAYELSKSAKTKLRNNNKTV